ncbi:hypothetical protein PYCCODRAFT_699446 [Trametes coccinea BRFM310]|uniref:Uncharacterized protein n=1 Tax=Trametes coccinea (strain BRFM310) TaxID=1353009 RepID=A0A1Y2IGW9_TRAC3|nr:hypothetical protein PYCCODRAFT_699446 [Trametes coccinea BRFM310]
MFICSGFASCAPCAARSRPHYYGASQHFTSIVSESDAGSDLPSSDEAFISLNRAGPYGARVYSPSLCHPAFRTFPSPPIAVRHRYMHRENPLAIPHPLPHPVSVSSWPTFFARDETYEETRENRRLLPQLYYVVLAAG